MPNDEAWTHRPPSKETVHLPGITCSETYSIPSAAGGTQVAIITLDSTRFGTNPTVDVSLSSPDWVSLVAFSM